MRHFYSFIIGAISLLLVNSPLQAQDDKATSILDGLSKKMQQYESVSADFSSKMVDKQADMTVDQEGSIRVSGENYHLTLGDITVICDGENVWTYSKKTNEVMIDLAEDIYDEEGLSPADLFTVWETGFKNQYDSEQSLDGVACHVIKLFPKEPQDKTYHTIKLFIGKEEEVMKRAIILGKEGNDITYDLENFDTGFIASTAFRFDKSEYPGVEVIDNR
jgi:outer membrane lipoprotein-sorting protein